MLVFYALPVSGKLANSKIGDVGSAGAAPASQPHHPTLPVAGDPDAPASQPPPHRPRQGGGDGEKRGNVA